MTDHTAERIQHNNNVFRDANERIRHASEKYDHRLELIPFLCECPVEDCMEIVRLTQDQYAAVRAHPQRFMTAPGHEGAEAPVARLVEQNDGYVIVEK